MERTLCAELSPGAACEHAVIGWVAAVRRFGGLTFLILRDRSGTCQAVLEGGAPAPPMEAIVRVTGFVRAQPRAYGGVELRAAEVETLVEPASPLPFTLHRPEIPATLETVLEHRAASLRHPAERHTFAVQAALTRGFRRYLDAIGFTETHTPKLVGGATEGGAEVFRLDYFGRPAYLAQSPQLYKQMLVGAGFERVYEVAPVYRAEPHATTRHLNEYVSLDVETELFTGGGTAALIALECGLLGAMFAQVAADCGVGRLPDPGDAVTLTLEEALRLVGRPDLDPEGERLLTERAAEMVFVTGWPVEKRPFYALEGEDRPGVTESFDLILRGLEVTTGGQREHRADRLVAAMVRRGVPTVGFEGYLEAFAYGMPPHGGFAIGLERLTAQLLGLPNVRRASLFPRDRHRLAP